MINYIVTEDRDYTIQCYLDHWNSEDRHLFRIISYSDMWLSHSLPGGNYIFSDLERLTSAELKLAQLAYESVTNHGKGAVALNQPMQATDRYELLSRLYASGLNKFKAHKITIELNKIRYPVFLRESNDHHGSISGLLWTPKDVDVAVARAMFRGFNIRDLLLIEFIDTLGADGIYRKYSYFRIGDALIPRHVLFSQKWLLKYIDLQSEQFFEEEQTFLKNFLHKDEVMKIFQIAQIDYGRIDFSIDQDGQLQTWEINMNPTIFLNPDEYSSARMPQQHVFAKQVRAAFEPLFANTNDSSYPFSPPENLVQQAIQQRNAAMRSSPHPRLVHVAGNYPSLVRPLGWLARKFGTDVGVRHSYKKISE